VSDDRDVAIQPQLGGHPVADHWVVVNDNDADETTS
jgi:hypothetical protein